jgi:hypothetical protein
LGLWPLKVRYQNYLDEGLNPEVVKSLFTELGLDLSIPKPAASSQGPPTNLTNDNLFQPQLSTKTTSQQHSPPSEVSKSSTNKPLTGGDSTMQPQKSAQEERKDKIARMLAEKSKKNTAPSTSAATPSGPPAPPPAIESSDHAKVKLRAQNNQKILEKLAALKKQQGKKPESTGTSPAVQISEQGQKQASPAHNSAVTSKQTEAGPSIGEPETSSTPSGPLGLSAPSSPHTTPKPRSTKRPIASDFDGFSSNGNALKRTRTQETLIIDVSDDEDVEMDLGSPTELPSSAIQNSAVPRQNSLASSGPLSNARNWRGPKSNSATPASGTPGHGQKLDLLTQQIQEARRKIAEAEAKKAAANKSNGNSTPATQSPARTPGPPESASLPKTSDGTQALGSERRDRIASYHIPVLDAALREKQERLQRLQAEAAQLAIEVQATLDERQKLTAEMESMDISKAEIPNVNGRLGDVGSPGT